MMSRRSICLALVAVLVMSFLVDAVELDMARLTARTRRRRETKFAANKLACVKGIATTDHFEGFPLGAGAQVKWAGGKWEFNAGVNSNVDGSDVGGKEHMPVDFCRVDPPFCAAPGGKQSLCARAKVQTANMCCPQMGRVAVAQLPKGPGGPAPKCTANGMPRAWMPQVKTLNAGAGYGKLVTWAKTQPAPLNTLVLTGSINGESANTAPAKGAVKVAVADFIPSQDEVMLGNTFNKLCSDAGQTPVPHWAPFLSSDNYIIDGHHRWSQIRGCQYLADATPCPPGTPDQLYVVQSNLDIDQILIPILTEAKNGWGIINPPTPKAVKPCCGDVEFIAPGFVELEARFGRSRHQTVAEAAMDFAVGTQERMAEAGLELKGGLQAHIDMFHTFHAKNLGW